MVKRFDINEEDHQFVQEIEKKEDIGMKTILQLAFAIGFRKHEQKNLRQGPKTVSSSVDDFDSHRCLRLLVAERHKIQNDEESFTEIMKYVFAGIDIIKKEYLKETKIDFLKILKEYEVI